MDGISRKMMNQPSYFFAFLVFYYNIIFLFCAKKNIDEVFKMSVYILLLFMSRIKIH